MEGFILKIIGGVLGRYAPHFLAKYNFSVPMVGAIVAAVPEVMKLAPDILAKANASDMEILEKMLYHQITQAEVNAQMDRATAGTGVG
jgi:hypothetical protein